MYEHSLSPISSQVFISLYVRGDCYSSWGAGLLLVLFKVSSILEAFILLSVLGWSGDVISSISFNDVTCLDCRVHGFWFSMPRESDISTEGNEY